MFLLFLRQYLKYYIAYRSQIVFRIVVVAIRVVIVCSLIQAVYRLSGNVTIGGIDALTACWAVVFSQTASAYGPQGFIEKIVRSIRSGQIATELITPGHYVWRKNIESLGDAAANTLFVLPWTVGIGALFLWSFPADGISILYALVLMGLGIIMRRVSHLCLGLLAFMTEEVTPFKWIWNKFEMLFGGNILPIPFMPAVMQSIAFFGPFAHVGYTAGLMFSRPDPMLFIQYALTVSFWIVIFYLITHILFTYGVRKLESFGG